MATVVLGLAEDPDASATVRLQAATYAIDRVEGRPAQAVALAVAAVPDGSAVVDAASALLALWTTAEPTPAVDTEGVREGE